MRVWMTLVMIGLVGCDKSSSGGSGDDCAEGVELGEAEAGCACGDETFELMDNGEICSCESDGLLCEVEDECRSSFSSDCG
ncbi:MAG: hypothetical protein H0V89_13675 [Deltaproteobacteria bacterium]|nr:hypothetical protein [Deltaproteobacteria bacterium]